jgi:AcrR family transcriptional regulator
MSTVKKLTASTDARVAKSRAKLHDALLALVSEQKFETITVADIVARAGIGYATFFRHYVDKNQLWWEIADEIVDGLAAKIAPFSEKGDSFGVARELCRDVDANRAMYRSIMAQGASSAVNEELVRRMTAAGPVTQKPMSVPRDLAVIFSATATFGILVWWLERHEDLSVDEVAAIVDRLAIRPLYTQQ